MLTSFEFSLLFSSEESLSAAGLVAARLVSVGELRRELLMALGEVGMEWLLVL